MRMVQWLHERFGRFIFVLYLFVQKTFLQRIVGRIIDRRRLGHEFNWRHEWLGHSNLIRQGEDNCSDKKRIWFHAASVGELESLLPLMDYCFKSDHFQIVLSVFSSSAIHRLESVKLQFGRRNGFLLYCGLAPWEGQWKKAFELFQPNLFVTAKYEAWPDLWMSLIACQIPLWVLACQVRGSFRMILFILKIFKISSRELKDFTFFATDSLQMKELKKFFPQSCIEVLPDPRWDRALERILTVSIRAQYLLDLFSSLPRPWIVLGNAWDEDLKVWGQTVRSFEGTLWIVPHEVNSRNLERLKKNIHKNQSMESRKPMSNGPKISSAFSESFHVFSTSEYPTGSPAPAMFGKTKSDEKCCVLVDEVGILAELYSKADAAYVGGGFSQSIHNPIEPSVCAIPVALGKKGVGRFTEIGFLREKEQLSILHSKEDLCIWIEQCKNVEKKEREKWMKHLSSQLGSSQKLHQRLERVEVTKKSTRKDS